MGMASAVNVSNPYATMPLTQDKHGSDHETSKFHFEVFPSFHIPDCVLLRAGPVASAFPARFFLSST